MDMSSDRELLEQEVETNIQLRIKLDFLRGVLDNIDEYAKEGMTSPAPCYACSHIRDLVAVGLAK